MNSCQLYLASSSPRRAKLLEQLGVCYRIVKPEIMEEIGDGELPAEMVLRLAIEKARKGAEMVEEPLPVLAADTIVLVGNTIMGKPGDRNQAKKMLSRLSGKTHRVLTAVAICQEDRIEQAISETLVRFRHLTEEEQISYCNTDEPLDKAGGYAIQGLGAVFIESIRGSYSGVVGLPLLETSRLLSLFDINCLGNRNNGLVRDN
ncbi:MAG: nucleoside triphosphate pyrophosphatase [Gammaproteobacteria bacterium]|nr:nucleoside triphosphate pyrophosphatase [Gammaproteobacteria bacterium]